MRVVARGGISPPGRGQVIDGSPSPLCSGPPKRPGRCGASSEKGRRHHGGRDGSAAFSQRQTVRALSAADVGSTATSSEGAASSRRNARQKNALSPGIQNPRERAGITKRYRGDRPKIAVDVDEVLAQFLLSLNAYYADRFSETFEVRHYHEYYFCKVWNCSPDASNEIVHQFFDSRHFREEILPVPGALHALRALQAKCDLVVITSRQNVIQDATARWVETHFPGIFSDLYFCNHFALDGESVTKAAMCSRVGADLLIDDNAGYALDCAKSGLDVILFDYQSTYPWSKSCDDHEKIRTCTDWNGVLKRVDELYFLPTLPPID